MEKKELIDGLFITSDYCVWYEPKKTIILSDFHLGFEASLKDEGVSLPRYQKDEILNRLSTIIDKYEPRTMIVNGDFKHEFGRNRREEFYEVVDVIDYILDNCNLGVVRGNHDNFLKNITEKKNVPFYETPLHLNNLVLVHGHKEIDEDRFLIIGHEHPSIKIRDDMGALVKLSCFMYDKKNKILILPAFSPLAEGRDMINSEDFISEAIKGLAIADFHVYALTDEGLMDFQTVKDVRNAYPEWRK